MDKRYNLDSIEALFRSYLIAGNQGPPHSRKLNGLSRITVKNYMSDLRHFFGWTMYKLKSTDIEIILEETNTELIQNYKTELLEGGTPPKTVNRRLSTVRRFCIFCVEMKFLRHNAAASVSNIDLQVNQNPRLIGEFESYLKESSSSESPSQHIATIEEFFNEIET